MPPPRPNSRVLKDGPGLPATLLSEPTRKVAIFELSKLRNGASATPKQQGPAASQVAERNFSNLINTSCRQPSTFEGYLYKPSETGKLPNGSSETLPKPTIFRSDFFHFFNPMNVPCSHPGGRTQLIQPDQHLLPPAKHVRRLLVQTLRNGKAAKRVF